MIFVKNSRGGREVNMINTLSKINLSKIGWEGGEYIIGISHKNLRNIQVYTIRFISDISMVYLNIRHISGICLTYVRHISCIFQVYLWNISGMSGISQICLNLTFGISYRYISGISQVCLRYFSRG